jgi:hypothetical protein
MHLAIWSMGIMPAQVCSAAAREPCKLTAMGIETVAGIRDGRCRSRIARIATGSDALKIICRRDVRLKQLGPERDRYERLVAFVQQVLLEQGQARVSARIGSKACADVLLSAERTAGMSHRSRSPTPISPSCSQKILPDCGCAGVNLCW